MPPFGVLWRYMPLLCVVFFCSYKQFGAFSGNEAGLSKPYFVADILVFYWLPSGPLGYSPSVVNYIRQMC